MLDIQVERYSRTPLIRQIYQQIRTTILQDRLTAGERLPSTRDLAEILGVSRIVVVEAYELLAAEGFLEGKSGSGTYVAAGASLTSYSPNLSFKSVISKEECSDVIDFRSGIPALDLFPRKKWGALSQKAWSKAMEEHLSYDSPEGRLELRTVIASYLKKTRGLICIPEQILITSGSVQGLILVAQALLSATSTAIVEDPSNRDIRRIFSLTGSVVLPIPADESGIQTSKLPEKVNPVFIQVTPSHQFPLGGILPIQRRIELIQYARDNNCYLIEDDYDSEYRYQGPPINALQGLGPEQVIYLGTFSKVLFPALRLGYMVLPQNLIAKFRDLKRINDMHSNSLNQLVMAYFIQTGDFERHIVKMKKVYRSRRDTLVQVLKSNFGKQVRITGDTTGLHLVADFTELKKQTGFMKLQKYGVKIYPVEEHSIVKGFHTNQFILGYGHLKEERIIEGIQRLKQALGM